MQGKIYKGVASGAGKESGNVWDARGRGRQTKNVGLGKKKSDPAGDEEGVWESQEQG